MTVAATLGTWEMASTVLISMNAIRPIQYTTVMSMLTVPTLMEASCAHVILDTLGMESAAVSSNAALGILNTQKLLHTNR